MKVSQAGIDLIKQFEGCKLTAYRDTGNVLTIGWGHTSEAGPPAVKEGMKITQEEANSIFAADVGKFSEGVAGLIKVAVTQKQFDALVSFAYNVGIPQFSTSTLLKKLNSGDYEAVPPQLMRWTKDNGKEISGLVRRRRAEAALWRDIDENAQTPKEEQGAKPTPPEPSKTMVQSREGNAAVAIGSASTIALATQVVPLVKEGSNILPVMGQVFGQPFMIALAIAVIASAAIWYWRRQRLHEEGK